MPLITITDSFGNIGNEIAQSVAQSLNVGLFNDEKLQTMVMASGIAMPSAYRFDNRAPGFWERLRSREPMVYLKMMEAAVYDIARNGDGVIVGHGSQMLLRDFTCAFHVRLLSDFNTRVKHLIAGRGMSRDVAEKLMTQYDKSQKTFFRYAFHNDIDTMSLYDLVINMSKMESQTVTDLIIGAVQSDDIQSCSLDALSSMKILSLERKINAQLLENNIDVSILHIEIPELGRATITGMVESRGEEARIIEIVKNVEGIHEVATDLSVWVYAL